MRVQKVSVHRVAASGPGDLSGVRALIAAGQLDPRAIVAVMGKTEGNGCVNDHTREYASVMWSGLLAEALGCSLDEAHERVALVMSGGTEGVLSPHFTVFSRSWVEVAAPAPQKRMVIGCAQTAVFSPEQLGRLDQVQATADAVRAAIRMPASPIRPMCTSFR